MVYIDLLVVGYLANFYALQWILVLEMKFQCLQNYFRYRNCSSKMLNRGRWYAFLNQNRMPLATSSGTLRH